MVESVANKTLRERAIVLANRLKQTSQPENTTQYLIFQIGESLYGIDSGYVMKAVQNPVIYPLPNAPQFIVGMLNENGKIICVNDGHRLFGLEQNAEINETVLILLHHLNVEFALVIDHVLGMESISPQQIDTKFFDSSKPNEISIGISQNNVILLDAKKIFSHPSLIVNQNPSIRQP